MVYQFTVHSNLPQGSAAPVTRMFQLYGKLIKNEPLTREEKDYVADRLYGVFGRQSSSYKQGGFLAPFGRQLPRFLVKVRHYGWLEYYAPDKTSLRKALGSYRVEEIIAA